LCRWLTHLIHRLTMFFHRPIRLAIRVARGTSDLPPTPFLNREERKEKSRVSEPRNDLCALGDLGGSGLSRSKISDFGRPRLRFQLARCKGGTCPALDSTRCVIPTERVKRVSGLPRRSHAKPGGIRGTQTGISFLP
jgi:hypothetical protein